MKRDMGLVRKILLELEKRKPGQMLQPGDIKGVDENVFSYHVKIMSEAGLIEGMDASGGSTLTWWARDLTWEGQDFLDAARDDTTWKKAMVIVKEKGGGLAFDVLKALLTKLMTDALLGRT